MSDHRNLIGKPNLENIFYRCKTLRREEPQNYTLLQKNLYFGMKTNSKSNFQHTIQISALYPTKVNIQYVFSFLFLYKKIDRKQKMMLRDGEVARTFLVMFHFWFFLLFRFVLKKYV
jgi:hypothetical protein